MKTKLFNVALEPARIHTGRFTRHPKLNLISQDCNQEL